MIKLCLSCHSVKRLELFSATQEYTHQVQVNGKEEQMRAWR